MCVNTNPAAIMSNDMRFTTSGSCDNSAYWLADTDDYDGVSTLVNNEELAITGVVNVPMGTTNKTFDQGIFRQPLGALGGYTWADNNTNGQQDDGASEGLNGITVKIYRNTSGTANPATDILVATQTTQNDNAGRAGYYLFDNLTPANYYVIFTLPSGFTYTTRGATGTSDNNDSDPNTTTGITEITTIFAYEIDKTWDNVLANRRRHGRHRQPKPYDCRCR